MATRRSFDEDKGNLFAGIGKPRQRTPREVVVEILAEGLWSLICDGRGPRHDRDIADPIAGSEPTQEASDGRPSA